MSNTLGIILATQSNADGRQSSTGGAGNGPPFYVAQPGVRVLGWDGFVLGNWATGPSDPYADTTNAADGPRHATRQTASPLSSLGTGPALPFADYLRQGGTPASSFTPDTRNMLVVPCQLASTYIAADWKDSGGFDTEPSYSTLLGTLKNRILMAARAPNFKLGPIIFCSGESEAFDASAATSLALATDLGAVFDSINTFVSASATFIPGGITWDKTTHFLIPQLPSTYAGSTFLANVRAAFTTLDGRADTITVTDAFSGGWLHLNKAEQIQRAGALANAWLAAP